jgi:hypothetical protein
MRYEHENFTKMILKVGFIILLYNLSAPISAMEAGGLEVEECMIHLKASF